jgi:hypothetical protein
MSNAFHSEFVAKWMRMRERYRADPEEHGVNHARLVALWKRFGGRCHLCGGHVPHPILELETVNKDNAPTADHAKPRAEGGKCGMNLRLAHNWCNSRRGRQPLNPSLLQLIQVEAAGRFGPVSDPA